jgi:uncharacterized phiE125 gp8 family phage protein
MPLKLITAPVLEPVSIEEVRLFLRIDSEPGEEDGLIGSLISAARAEAENRTSRQFITATWELYLDCFGEEILQIPLPPLQSTGMTINYLDSAGASKLLLASDYRIDTISVPGRVTPAYGILWPDTYPVTGAVVIRFVAGYGATAETVPIKIRQWIKVMVGSLWENRETVVVSPSALTLVKLDFLDGLLDEYRIYSF